MKDDNGRTDDDSLDIHQMSPYAPIRDRSAVWWRYAMGAVQHGWINAKGMTASQLLEHLRAQVVDPMSMELLKEVNETPESTSYALSGIAKLMEFRHWVPLAAQYELCGRQIFDLSDDLAEMLAHTDIGECTLDEWYPPYDCLYLRFGKRENAKQVFSTDENGNPIEFEYLDGAYVAVTPYTSEPETRRIKFGLTTVHEDGSGVQLPGYFLDLIPEEQSMPVLEGIQAGIRRRIRDFSERDEKGTFSAHLSEHRRRVLEDGAEIMIQALSLVINAMFYIESVTDTDEVKDVEPGRDTPPSQTVEWLNASPNKRQKLNSRLTRDGYVLVHLLGKGIAGPQAAGKKSTKRRTHWRRGHWRQQAHGPGLSLRKRTWVKPVVVNRGDADDGPMPGHIYVAGSSDGTDSTH